jgi:DNA processing protein
MSSSGRRQPRAPGACVSCLRRSWLLSVLSGPLEYCARDRERLIELLALTDGELLAAVAGRRTVELKARYERFPAGELACGEDLEAICRHRRGYPHALNGPAAPRMLDVAGGAGRLAKLTAAPVVAILGSRAASDYGLEMARSLARGLAASGVTVAAGLTDGIAIAAHAGALDASGGTVAVMGGGLGVSCPARRRSLYARIKRDGCAVSELPRDCRGRRWGQLASERIVVELAGLAVVVEAEQTPGDLAGARIAQALGRAVAAIPGRVTSPLSRGTHALLMDGASLIRGPQDVLELLYRIGASPPDGHAAREPRAGAEPYAELEPRLKATLERVGAGCDTPDKLTRAGADSAEVLLALSELELIGLLARGDGGRYVPRHPLPAGEPSGHRSERPPRARTSGARRA